MAVLRVDANATVVEAALKGYLRWRIARRKTEEDVRPLSLGEARAELTHGIGPALADSGCTL